MPRRCPENPIRKIVLEIIDSGKLTKEQICVACDLKFDTLCNMFWRDTVSPYVRMALYHGSIIPQKLLKEYDQWFLTVYQPWKKGSRGHSKTAARTKNKRSDATKRDEEADLDASL